MKVLIVDDDYETRKVLRLTLEVYQCYVIEAENGARGLEMAARHRPDLILSDSLMPVMDGFQFLRNLKANENLRSIPFVFYSGVYTGPEEAGLALSYGAEAYILKPKSPADLWGEISEILERRSEGKAKEEIPAEPPEDEEKFLRQYSRIVVVKLEEKVKELEDEIRERRKAEEELMRSEASYRELSDALSSSVERGRRREEDLQRSRDAFLNMLEDISESYRDLRELFDGLVTVMVNALDAKSPWTKGHSVRVAMYAGEIAKEMALDEDEIKKIHLAGMLHDIGKIGTYDQLLDKPAKLTEEEFAIVKKHPAQGETILGDIRQLRDILPLIRHHHERIDGKGYPDGLSGDGIPLGARILHVADTFDAMMADRPYRPSPGLQYALAELNRNRGSQFDAAVATAFLRIIENRQACIPEEE